MSIEIGRPSRVGSCGGRLGGGGAVRRTRATVVFGLVALGRFGTRFGGGAAVERGGEDETGAAATVTVERTRALVRGAGFGAGTGVDAFCRVSTSTGASGVGRRGHAPVAYAGDVRAVDVVGASVVVLFDGSV